MNEKVIFITGAGHSGSTLLGLIMGSHSQALGLGELTKIGDRLHKPYQDFPQLCMICQGECEFWNHQLPQEMLEKYFSRNPITRYAAYKQNNIYNFFADYSHAHILVDFTKQTSWIIKQLKWLKPYETITPFLLYITRDGRAVTNSRLRKYPNSNMSYEATKWKKAIEQFNRFYANFPAHQKLQLAYEQLATHPEETIQHVCNVLGISYEPQMLNYWEHEHHLGPCNLGTVSLIKRYQKEKMDMIALSEKRLVHERHGDHYDNLGLAIRLDLRWQEELTKEQMETFEKVAGKINQPFVESFESHV